MMIASLLGEMEILIHLIIMIPLPRLKVIKKRHLMLVIRMKYRLRC